MKNIKEILIDIRKVCNSIENNFNNWELDEYQLGNDIKELNTNIKSLLKLKSSYT